MRSGRFILKRLFLLLVCLTPAAVAAIDEAASRGQGVSEAAMLLGIDLTAGPARLDPPTGGART